MEICDVDTVGAVVAGGAAGVVGVVGVVAAGIGAHADRYVPIALVRAS
jgi:hypothetical protein